MFSLACNLAKNKVEFLPVESSTIRVTSKKVSENNVDFSTIEKSTWKRHGYFDQQNYIEKSMWKQRGFFNHRNYAKKICGNDVVFGSSKLHQKSTWK